MYKDNLNYVCACGKKIYLNNQERVIASGFGRKNKRYASGFRPFSEDTLAKFSEVLTRLGAEFANSRL